MDERPLDKNAPNWSDIDEQILCPLCDYNLRGLIEPRCPECGYRFYWPELLDPTLRLHPYVFEHHPERNIWSFWRTLGGTLLPRRFWKTLHPAQPSRMKRLIAYALIVGLLAVSTLSVALIAPLAVEIAKGNVRQRQWFVGQLKSPANAAWKENIKSRYGSLDAFLETVYPRPASWAFVRSNKELLLDVIPGTVLYASWPWLTFGALMIFQWSMKRAKVNRSHILRCVTYSFDGAIALSTVGVASIVGGIASGAMREFMSLLVGLAILSVAAMIYRLCVAYKTYLRFDHPISTVLASQVIVGLVAFNILLVHFLW